MYDVLSPRSLIMHIIWTTVCMIYVSTNINQSNCLEVFLYQKFINKKYTLHPLKNNRADDLPYLPYISEESHSNVLDKEFEKLQSKQFDLEKMKQKQSGLTTECNQNMNVRYSSSVTSFTRHRNKSASSASPLVTDVNVFSNINYRPMCTV